MSKYQITLGGTVYEFETGSIETLGGREEISIWDMQQCLAILHRARSSEPVFSNSLTSEGIVQTLFKSGYLTDDQKKMLDERLGLGIDKEQLGPVEFHKPGVEYKKRTPYSYLTEIIEKSLDCGNHATALAAVKELANYPCE